MSGLDGLGVGTLSDNSEGFTLDGCLVQFKELEVDQRWSGHLL